VVASSGVQVSTHSLIFGVGDHARGFMASDVLTTVGDCFCCHQVPQMSGLGHVRKGQWWFAPSPRPDTSVRWQRATDRRSRVTDGPGIESSLTVFRLADAQGSRPLLCPISDNGVVTGCSGMSRSASRWIPSTSRLVCSWWDSVQCPAPPRGDGPIREASGVIPRARGASLPAHKGMS
jgi:hypothetical protein